MLEAEIDEELAYQEKLAKHYQYAYDRCKHYPDGFEQLDMLWHAVNQGIDLKDSEWFQTIKEVKEMNKFHKFVTFIAVVCTVGLTYAVFTLKGMPEAFDWEDDE